MQLNRISLSPFSFDAGIAALHFQLDRVAIQVERRLLFNRVRVFVDVARKDSVLRPTWNAHQHAKGFVSLGVESYADLSFPRISSLLLNGNAVSTGEAHRGFASDQEIDVNRIGRLRIDVTPERSHKAHDIRGTAGNINPIEAFVVAERAQGILIEEPISWE